MALTAWFAEAWLATLIPGGGTTLQAVRVFAAIALAVAVLSAAAWLLRLSEFEEARRMAVGRLTRLRR
jgi:hypothetical protein